MIRKEHYNILLSVQFKDIQPLRTFNFGGDEVSHDAWVNSTMCKEMINMNPELEGDMYTSQNTILHQYFVENVSELAQNYSLDLAGWEDGLKFNNSAIKRQTMCIYLHDKFN